MIMFGIEVRDEMLGGAPQLKWIQSLATGVDHFLRCPSLKPDVLITSGRGIHGPPMREQVVYLMMAVSRDAKRQVEDHQHHIWQRRLWSTLHGKTAVVVGTGIVGAAIGELLRAFGMHTIGVTRTPRKIAGFDDVDAGRSHCREAAAKADYLINVLPASADNIGLFDAKVFGAMKPSAYYISAGRGQTVDEDALAASLARAADRRRRIRRIPGRTVAAGEPILAIAERVHHAACRRLCRRIRGFRHAADRRQYAAVPRRAAERHAKYRAALSAASGARGFAYVFPSHGNYCKIYHSRAARKKGDMPRVASPEEYGGRCPCLQAVARQAQIADHSVRRGATPQTCGTAASGLQGAREGAQFRRPDHGARRRHRALDRIQGRHDHLARRPARQARHQIDVQERQDRRRAVDAADQLARRRSMRRRISCSPSTAPNI